MSFFKDLKPVYTNNNNNHSTSVVSLAKEIHTSHNRHTDNNNINNNNNIARINKRNKKQTVNNDNTHLASLNGLSQYWHVEKGLFIDPNDIPQQQQQQQRSSIQRNIIQLRIQNTMNNTDYNSTTEKKKKKVTTQQQRKTTTTCMAKLLSADKADELISKCLIINPVRHLLNEFTIGPSFTTKLTNAKMQWASAMQNVLDIAETLNQRNHPMREQDAKRNEDDIITRLTLTFLNNMMHMKLRGCIYEFNEDGLIWHGGLKFEYLKWIQGKTFSDPKRIYHAAARVGMYETVVNLVENGYVNINMKDIITDRTAIMNAARYKHAKVMKYILSKYTNQITLATDVDSNGLTLLMHAAFGGNLECLKLASTLPGVDINHKTTHAIEYNHQLYAKGLTALTIASYWGHIDCVRYFFQLKGIDVNCQNDDGYTPLLCCIRHPKLVQVFFENPEVNLNALTKLGSTPIMGVAFMSYYQSIDVFVSNPKVELNHVSRQGNTVLGLAARNGMAKMVRALLTRPDMDCTIVSRIGLNALHLAAAHGKSDCVALLMHAPGVDINARGSASQMTAFMMAAQCGSIASIRCLIEHPDIDINLTYKTTPDGPLQNALTTARSNGHMDVVKILEDNGCHEPVEKHKQNSHLKDS